MKLFLFILIWTVYVWGACYSFVLFPWPSNSLAWWSIPHLFSLAMVAIGLAKLCIKIEEV